MSFGLPSLAPRFAQLLLAEPCPYRVCFLVEFAKLPVELRQVLQVAIQSGSPSSYVAVTSWKPTALGLLGCVFRCGWIPEGKATCTIAFGPAAAREFAQQLLSARVEQLIKHSDNPSWVKQWSSGWRYLAQARPETFGSALYQCRALRRTLIYLALACACDSPILEAIWCSLN